VSIIIVRSDGEGDVREVWPNVCCPPMQANDLHAKLTRRGAGYYIVSEHGPAVQYDTLREALRDAEIVLAGERA
jgi:hypothetical protein